MGVAFRNQTQEPRLLKPCIGVQRCFRRTIKIDPAVLHDNVGLSSVPRESSIRSRPLLPLPIAHVCPLDRFLTS
jgi:hypothetical protein